MTQKEAVLRYMMEHGKISSFEAFSELGITRLSAVIFDLRKEHNVVTYTRNTVNRYGHGTQYAEYYLKGEVQS